MFQFIEVETDKLQGFDHSRNIKCKILNLPHLHVSSLKDSFGENSQVNVNNNKSNIEAESNLCLDLTYQNQQNIRKEKHFDKEKPFNSNTKSKEMQFTLYLKKVRQTLKGNTAEMNQ